MLSNTGELHYSFKCEEFLKIACPCLVLGDGECKEDNSSGLENL